MTDSARAFRAIDLLDGRWTLSILAKLAQRGRRYQDLHDGLHGISYKVLTRRFAVQSVTGLLLVTSTVSGSRWPRCVS